MIEMRKADQRGVANLGWLRSFHTFFPFASYSGSGAGWIF